MTEPADGESPDTADFCQRCHHEFQPPVNEPVVDASGREYEHAMDADVTLRIWCPDCWKEHQREKHTENNHQLGEFSA